MSPDALCREFFGVDDDIRLTLALDSCKKEKVENEV